MLKGYSLQKLRTLVRIPYYLAGICALANETGVCEAYIPSYFYDHMTGQCRQFIYGGCGGNQNRFSTREDCEAQCSAQGKNLW